MNLTHGMMNVRLLLSLSMEYLLHPPIQVPPQQGNPLWLGKITMTDVWLEMITMITMTDEC